MPITPKKNFSLSDFDFALPSELIAQHPAAQRTDSRLLQVDTDFQDLRFPQIENLLNPGDVLVFNDSKVIPARLFGTKETGGAVELLIERITSPLAAVAMLRASKKPPPGAVIQIHRRADAHPHKGSGAKTSTDTNLPTDSPKVTVIGRDLDHSDRFLVSFEKPVLEVLSEWGEIPLPPYIEHVPDTEDSIRYQTVYAAKPGSVAAPTAGLHFDEALLQALDRKGVHRAHVTLHVGTGTFAPVRTEKIEDHRMHSEWCEIPESTAQLIAQARREGRRVIAVGTTSLRTLESGALSPLAEPPPGVSHGAVRPGTWETDIFIYPGYQFKVVDGLLTNFHLPKSTLLMLVAAFIGYDRMRKAYDHAVKNRYRFFSYGDAMFCTRQSRPNAL